jgi:hypothetical protein
LAGTESVGSVGSSTEWAMKFSHLTYDKFIFANGDF